MKKMSKEAAIRSYKRTERIFKQVLVDLFPKVFENLKSIDKISTRDMKDEIFDQGYNYDYEAVDREYIKRVCTLTNKQLQTIIDANMQELVRRAPATIDRIMNELLERELDPDRFRLYNPSNGKIAGKTTKRSSSKKADK